MDGALWDRLNRAPLYLDQTRARLELERAEVERFYAPLARLVGERLRPDGRTLVAVAGPPGSGKSAFAATLAAVVNALAADAPAAVVGLDGWHYPNSYLDTHAVRRGATEVTLRAIKGAPETYDLAAVGAFLRAARAAPRLAYPVYSRALHDPIPEAGVLEERHALVVLEGKYWLLDEPPWRAFASLFDLRVFLMAEPADLLAGLRARHLRGSKSPAFVAEHMQRVDLPNIERVLRGSLPADVVVHKADSRRIRAVEWPAAGQH